MSFLEATNDWISSNQALVVSFGIPLFTLMITGWASFLSHRAKVSEVKLNGRIKLSEYRRANFDELLRLSGRLQTVFVEVASQQVWKSRAAGGDQTALLDVIECANLFLLRSHASLEQIKHFSDYLEKCISKIFSGKHIEDPDDDVLGALRVICKELLDQEWEQIVKELEGTIK